MARLFLAPFRFVALAAVVVAGVFWSVLRTAWVADRVRRRWMQIRIYNRFSPWILAIVGGHVEVVGALPEPARPLFVVANHLSDMDVIALQALRPSVFITSTEIQESPGLGSLAAFGGSYFVNRRSSIRLRRDLKGLENVIRQGFTVVLFPEGTSSSGEQVLPFRNALLASAIAAEAVLQPVCLQYRRIGGHPVTPANRDLVFYYGEMGFLKHVMGLCLSGGFDLQCRYLPAIKLKWSDSRKAVCDQAYQEISQSYRTLSSELTP